MPKNFDDLLGNDYEFTVRGEKFTFRDLSAREFAAVDEILQDAKNGKEDDRTMWDRFSEQIAYCLPDDQRERWLTLYNRDEEPVTVGQLIGMRNWLLEVQMERDPTKAASTSGPGRGRTAASSREG